MKLDNEYTYYLKFSRYGDEETYRLEIHKSNHLHTVCVAKIKDLPVKPVSALMIELDKIFSSDMGAGLGRALFTFDISNSKESKKSIYAKKENQ